MNFIEISSASIDQDASSTEVLSSDGTGITLQLTVKNLSISEQKIDGKLYHTISYKDCQYTRESSKPKIPVSRVMMGVPVSADCDVRIVNSSSAVRKYGYRVSPVPKIDYHQQDINNGPPVTKSVYEEDASIYQSNESYPLKTAKIVNDGILRNQRVVTVELHPIQYSPQRKMIRIYSTLTVRVDFHSASAPPSAPGLTPRLMTPESPQFEKLYRSSLVNYADAKKWRSNPQDTQHAGTYMQYAPRNTQQATELSYKIYVEKTGIYRLTYEGLRDKNIDLSDKDPRYFRMLNRGKEIRIYVKGESDGSFDEGDYIEFLGVKSDSRYTRWNVYWLETAETKLRGIRVAEVEGQPSEPTSPIVQSFRSKLHFEKDLLHNVLPELPPQKVSNGDPDAWFEALDLWFWTGVKNASEKTEVALNFKLYDVAQSFEQPEINVFLRGGTPAEHEGLISVNDIKIDVAKWSSQDKYIASKLLHSSYSIVDATNGDNVLRLNKVDSDVTKDALRYPYHIYLNHFDIEYTLL